MNYETLVQAFTPILNLKQLPSNVTSLFISQFFAFLDQPLGHLVYINSQSVYFVPNLSYLKIQAPFGLIEFDCPPHLETIMDQLSYLFQLYPGLASLKINDIHNQSFAAVRWVPLNIDPIFKIDNDIFVYYSLSDEILTGYLKHSEENSKIQNIIKNTVIDFDLKTPTSKFNYYQIKNSIYTQQQVLQASAAVNNTPSSLQNVQDSFRYLCRFLGFSDNFEIPKIQRNMIIEKLDIQIQFLLNLLYVRHLRKISKTYYLNKTGPKKIQLVKPFSNGKVNEFFTSWNFLNDNLDSDIKAAILDSINSVFEKKKSQQDDRVLFNIISKRQDEKDNKKVYIDQYGEVISFDKNTLDDVLLKLTSFIQNIIADAKYQGNQSTTLQPKKNQFLVEQKSLAIKEAKVNTVLADQLQFFSQEQDYKNLYDSHEFDFFNLQQVAQKITRSQTCLGSQIKLTIYDLFLTENDNYNLQKENIRKRLGKLWGYDMEIKVEIRLPTPNQIKKFTLKSKD